jgi:serine/threonine protein kinase
MFKTQVSTTINHAELTQGQELGRGGFGVVYRGTYRHNDVAIKQLLLENISEAAAQEFESEAVVMAQLRSPNIVQFYGLEQT